MGHEPTLMAFCEATGTTPEDSCVRMTALSGPDESGRLLTVTEDARSLDHVRLSDRPLIVCDVDEVVLEFLDPFQRFLRSSRPRPLAAIVPPAWQYLCIESGDAVADDPCQSADAGGILRDARTEWQIAAPRSPSRRSTELAADADIVFLTAMPPRHAAVQPRRCSTGSGLDYPLIATQDAEGSRRASAARRPQAALRFHRRYLAINLHSVREHAPDCLLINLMVNADFRPLAPDPGEASPMPATGRMRRRCIRAHISR